jgi:hypothetical protein
MTPDDIRDLFKQAMICHHEGIKVTVVVQIYITEASHEDAD